MFKLSQKYIDFCRDMTYKKTVSDALIGKESFCILKIQAAVYRVYANSIATENNSFAVFLFLKDVTEEENAQQMRREFTANVSHELKTPLTAIMGSAEIIESGIAKNEDIVLFASKIREESKRLLELIKDIIKLSRLDEGSIPQEFSDIDLLELCEEIKKELSLKLEEKSISLQICSDNSKIYGIKPVVHEIIFNLCDNAVNYNKVNGAVFVKTEKNGNWIDVSVKDSGMGIPDEDLPHIFERFYTADKSHSKERGGTGLGLSIVKHGALLHKAKITAQSVLGKGTTITVSFPNKELFNTL